MVQEIINKDSTRKSVVDDGVGLVNKFLDQVVVEKEKLIFLSSEEFTRGTTGLLANRLSVEFQLPAVIVSIDGKMASGSVRAGSGFDVVRMLEKNSDILIQFGGHKSAGGFIFPVEKLQEFKLRLVQYMEDFKSEDFIDEISVDAVIDNLEDVTLNNIRYLENILEPTGNGNDIPRFLIRKVKISSCREIGKSLSHILITITKESGEMIVIGWNWAKKIKCLIENQDCKSVLFDLVASPEINKYQGMEEIRLNLIDIKESNKS